MFSQEEADTYACLRPNTVKAKDTLFGKIYIHPEDGLVSFHQRWRYRFTLDQTFGKHAAKASPWTDAEERDFHYAAESIIWKFWNSHRTLPGSSDPTTQQFIDLLNKHSGISFSVSGDGEFAQKFAGRQLPSNSMRSLRKSVRISTSTSRKCCRDVSSHSGPTSIGET
jgi:hypothetical protein